VIVLHRCRLSDVLSLARSKPEGIIVVGTERLSHLLIYLYSLTMPAVLVDKDPKLREGSLVFVDGTNGKVDAVDGDAVPSEWLSLKAGLIEQDIAMKSSLSSTAHTTDGVDITLSASVTNVEGALMAKENNAAEIGLVRSEFLWTGDEPPNKALFDSAILRICEAARPLRVNVRLPDIGGEKVFNWAQGGADMREPLGLRGSRSYREPIVAEVIRSEILAIAQLSRKFQLGILLPYITNVEEFIELRSDVAKTAGHDQIDVGAVLETPAACMVIDAFLDLECDLYLGTSDIMQCFFGASRTLESVARYLDPYAPGLFRFLYQVANTAGSRVDRVVVCGQLPLFPYVIKLLVGLGFRKYSVEPVMIPHLSSVILKHSLHTLRDLAERAVSCSSAEEVFSMLSE